MNLAHECSMNPPWAAARIERAEAELKIARAKTQRYRAFADVVFNEIKAAETMQEGWIWVSELKAAIDAVVRPKQEQSNG